MGRGMSRLDVAPMGIGCVRLGLSGGRFVELECLDLGRISSSQYRNQTFATIDIFLKV